MSFQREWLILRTIMHLIDNPKARVLVVSATQREADQTADEIKRRCKALGGFTPRVATKVSK